jgi:putative DNA primase/helicase
VRAAADRAERTRRASQAARRPTMSTDEEPKDASSPAASGEGGGMAEMSDEDFQPTLAEGGEAAMEALVEKAKTAPGSVFEAETVRALAQLAKAHLPKWINLRARLKSAARDVPIAELDRRVRPSGPDASDGDDGLPGRALKYDEIEPWDELVDGAQLLTEIATAIESYVVMGAHQRDAAALWVVFAHAQDFFVYAPLLIVLSPIRRCGKTKLQEMLARLSPRPQSMSGITAAALARLVEKDRPTVFIDEFDAIANGNRELSESLRGQLNSSFNKSSAHILKSVPLPGGWEVRRFSTWAPTCVAGIGQVPNTVADRSVIIRLTRKLGMQSVKRLSARDGGELHLLARKIARFVADNERRLRRDEPDVPNELNDRARDAWEPLITIADIAGGEWPERARKAATTLAGINEIEAAEGDVRQTLLSDIRAIFAREFPKVHPDHEEGYGPRLATKRLLEKLHGLEERNWNAWGRARKPMTDVALAGLLKGYEIRSGTVRLEDGSTPKGYYSRSFEEAFERYLPPTSSSPRSSSRHAATPPGEPKESKGFAAATSEFCGGSENGGNRCNSAVCGDVAAQRLSEVESDDEYSSVPPDPEGDDEDVIWRDLVRNK